MDSQKQEETKKEYRAGRNRPGYIKLNKIKKVYYSVVY